MDENSPPPLVPASHALSMRQERKLVDNLDERFLDVTRNYKKRFEPSSSLPDLSAYLHAQQTLLSLILQIPPIDPSTSLRTALLLRLTNDAMNSIPGYPAEPGSLPELLAWLDLLDRGWVAVLRRQAWDTARHDGVESVLPEGAHASAVNQTERTRLRSLLVTGTGRMEEWLEELDGEGETFGEALERLGLQNGFDELFYRTLTEIGGLGEVASDPSGMIGTC
ncbi:hypothetical protein FA95DRAFT_1560838 [Auriscalpium vulgare]|uniref:Uncharacterized protein n=1 Tax=Auriscalpium vulgare TaxID=40419 RepID=A0ACB8RPQ4_9AGAM|nr:hypothetical protein FA95DRAFT_1560838 [Auriscalpium vulgare]